MYVIVMSPSACANCGMLMSCSLLRQGMDNLIVSLEGSEARMIEERAITEGWEQEKLQEVRPRILTLPRFFLVSISVL